MMNSDNHIIEEAVKLVSDGVCVTLPVKGKSMLPFIIGGQESVILQRPDNVKVGDVVLAWANNSLYVIHRIITIDGNRVVLMGDGNLIGKEYCTVNDIKARVTHVINAKGQTHDIYTRWRRWAAKLWFCLRPIRRYLLFIYKRI